MKARAFWCGAASGMLALLAAACSPAPAEKPGGREHDAAPHAPTAMPVKPLALRAVPEDLPAETPEGAPDPEPASTTRHTDGAPPVVVATAHAPEDLPASDAIPDTEPFPPVVTQFMVERDGCDHFRGEDAYDDDRRAYLEENMRQLCTGTDARLAELRHDYATNPDVIAALHQYDDRIETGDGQ